MIEIMSNPKCNYCKKETEKIVFGNKEIAYYCIHDKVLYIYDYSDTIKKILYYSNITSDKHFFT